MELYKRNGFNRDNYISLKAQDKSGERRLKKKQKLRENRLLLQKKRVVSRSREIAKKKVFIVIIAKKYLKKQISYNIIYNHLYHLAFSGGNQYLYNKHKKRKKITKRRTLFLIEFLSIIEKQFLEKSLWRL